MRASLPVFDLTFLSLIDCSARWQTDVDEDGWTKRSEGSLKFEVWFSGKSESQDPLSRKGRRRRDRGVNKTSRC